MSPNSQLDQSVLRLGLPVIGYGPLTPGTPDRFLGLSWDPRAPHSPGGPPRQFALDWVTSGASAASPWSVSAPGWAEDSERTLMVSEPAVLWRR